MMLINLGVKKMIWGVCIILSLFVSIQFFFLVSKNIHIHLIQVSSESIFHQCAFTLKCMKRLLWAEPDGKLYWGF